jgi:hypothetical protein
MQLLLVRRTVGSRIYTPASYVKREKSEAMLSAFDWTAANKVCKFLKKT